LLEFIPFHDATANVRPAGARVVDDTITASSGVDIATRRLLCACNCAVSRVHGLAYPCCRWL